MFLLLLFVVKEEKPGAKRVPVNETEAYRALEVKHVQTRLSYKALSKKIREDSQELTSLMKLQNDLISALMSKLTLELKKRIDPQIEQAEQVKREIKFLFSLSLYLFVFS